ncbi:quinolinate synthase NadA [uncultured Desulfobulbus sp.]|uniref:quinolinate synthase NadA n=1 Tax=uncultured Desulfobulbus sp. TaxID=239745 RepID=UPI0029C7B399|nr:quinolinate synthase NadA [uncultured Desulfobulbus sp.]
MVYKKTNESTSDLMTIIQERKKARNAIILAHNYQIDEVQDAADFVGDSLELSRKAADTSADVIVFCGVHFMAETAKILSPQKTVLIPDIKAGCPMADMITVEKLRAFKAKYPGRPVVAYVNTSAEVKAEVDICCTSANAVKIVDSVDADEILFVPDKCLADYVAARTTKKIIPFSGFCPTHHRILPEQILKQKELHPNAIVIAHPECTRAVLDLADGIFSTSGMIRFVDESPEKEFIVATELGILHRLKRSHPDKSFYSPSEQTVCPNMKKITLEKLAWSLEDMQYPIELPQEIIEKARGSIERMIAVT